MLAWFSVSNEPFCTQSQSISYRDQDDNEVVRIHQYLRPDPKRLFKDGVWYRLEKKKASDEVSASEGDEQKPVEPSSE